MKLMTIVGIGCLILFVGCSVNKSRMERVCDDIGGEVFSYKMGWSETCGFPIYRSTCVDYEGFRPIGYGKIIDLDIDYVLVNNNIIKFKQDPFPNTDNMNSSEADDAVAIWERGMCDKFSALKVN